MFFEQLQDSLVYRFNGETVKITPWGANGLRMQSAILADPDETSVALLNAGDNSISLDIQDRSACITNGKITARLTVSAGGSLRIFFYNDKGKLLLKEINADNALSRAPREFKSLPGGNFKIKARFEANPGEKISGMGQYQQDFIDLKGCNLELAHRNSQMSIPFYLSSLGYGFLWHNAAIGEVHFGTNTTEWLAESSKKLDYWITAGDTPAEIMKSYTNVTGTAPEMPEWGLGYWQCKLRYYNQKQALDVVHEYKKRGIPLDVIIIDYYHWHRCGDFKFDSEFFPDPAAMARELNEMGVRPMVSIWPLIDWRSENYEEMKRKGLLIKRNSGIDVHLDYLGNNVFLDATNPRAREYVWEKCKHNYCANGIKSFWLDEAEPEYRTYDFENYRCYAGAVLEAGNLYPREYIRLFYEGLRQDVETEIVNLARCAWVGSQRYGALVWSGDIHSTYEDFRRQICAGIHVGICGIPWWTTDIGGFVGGDINSPEFRELLVRWFQFGAFSPVMRMHGVRSPRVEVIDKSGEHREISGAPNEVWSYGPEVEKILVKFIKLRETMRPYTRSIMHEAHVNGSPVIRGLFYEFPEDQQTWSVKDEYMFGADILVAPVCTPNATSRDVYLPQGVQWTHAGTGKVYEGGAVYSIDAPLDTLPIFLRDGRQAFLVGKL